MGKKRDRSQLKFRLLLHIRDNPMGVSKYMLKKMCDIPTTKQIDGLLKELRDYISVNRRELKSGDIGNYYVLSEKGVDFLEQAEDYLFEFLGLTDGY